MSEIRCNGCRQWFPAEQGGCDACGWERPAGNKTLRVAALNAPLYEQAQRLHDGDRAYERGLHEEHRMARQLGIEPAAPRPLTPRDLGRAA